jgi:RNA-directed DNA polymerase
VARLDTLYGEPEYKDRGPGRTPRRIDKPRDSLKRIQRAIHELVMEAADFPSYVYGGIKGRSARQFAVRHRNKSCVIRLDINEFFPSITALMVENVFKRQLRCSKDVASLAARLLTRAKLGRTFLPQGCPTSTTVANLVLVPEDRRIQPEAARLDVEYGRYLDDIALSGRDARLLIPLAIGVIRGAGFRVSRRKLDVMAHSGTQDLVGLNVKSRLRPKRSFEKSCIGLLRQATDARVPQDREKLLQSLKGKLAYAKSFGGQFPVRLARSIDTLEKTSEVKQSSS